MAEIACGSVSVVCQAFNDNSYSARTVTLVGYLFKIVGVFGTRRFLYNAVDIVVGNVVVLRFCDKIFEFRVRRGVGTALFNRKNYLSSDFGEDFCALAVGLLLFVHDILPFGMSGHICLPP